MSAVASPERRAGRPKRRNITWYKAVHGMQDDPRYPAVAKRAGASVLEVIAIVDKLYECASRNRNRGSISNFDAESFAAFAGVDQAKIEAVVSALTDKGFILDGRLVDWARTQGENIVELSTSPGAIRTRRWRQKKRVDARQLEMVFVFTTSGKATAEPQPAVAVAQGLPPPERVTSASHHRSRGRHTDGQKAEPRDKNQDFIKEDLGSLRRFAPLDQPRIATTGEIQESAYDRAVKAAKRSRWLDNLTRWSVRRFPEDQMVEVWGIIGAARGADPLPQETKKTLNRLDKLYRLEKAAA